MLWGAGLALALIAGCKPAGVDPGAGGAVDLSRFMPELREMALIPGGVVELEPLGSRTDPTSLNGPAELGDLDDRETFRVGPFFMDRFEVTQAEYARFLEESGYRPENESALFDWKDGAPRAGNEQKPVVFVSLRDAKAYAAHHGKRLPTREEWALATRGSIDRNFPWGRSFNRNRLNCLETGIGRAWRVGTFESGKSPQGCYDLFGNVWEWILARVGDEVLPAIAGGSYLRAMEPEESPRIFEQATPNELSNDLGFRCVRDVTPGIYERYLDLLHSEWSSVRLRVIADLELLDRERSIQTLRDVQVNDRDPGVRIVAARRLIALGRGSLIDVDSLVQIVGSRESFDVRIDAVTCLNLLLALLEEGYLRPASEALFGILEGMASGAGSPASGPASGSGDERAPRGPVELFRVLARLLVEMEEPRVFPFLVELAMLSDREELCVASAEALGHFNFVEAYDHGAVLAALDRIIRGTRRNAVRSAAFDSLIGFDSPDTAKYLVAILEEPSVVDTHRRAAEELSRYESEESIRALGEALIDSDRELGTRVAAAGSLLGLRYVDAEQGLYLESLLRLGFGYLDRGMPGLFEYLERRDPELVLDETATLVMYYLEDIAIPRLFTAYWLDFYRRAQLLPEGVRGPFVAALNLYGVDLGMQQYLDGTAEPEPWVEIRPFLMRARMESLIPEQAGIARRRW